MAQGTQKNCSFSRETDENQVHLQGFTQLHLLRECLHFNLLAYVLNQIVLCACIHMPLEDRIFRVLSSIPSDCRRLSRRDCKPVVIYRDGL